MWVSPGRAWPETRQCSTQCCCPLQSAQATQTGCACSPGPSKTDCINPSLNITLLSDVAEMLHLWADQAGVGERQPMVTCPRVLHRRRDFSSATTGMNASGGVKPAGHDCKNLTPSRRPNRDRQHWSDHCANALSSAHATSRFTPFWRTWSPLVGKTQLMALAAQAVTKIVVLDIISAMQETRAF